MPRNLHPGSVVPPGLVLEAIQTPRLRNVETTELGLPGIKRRRTDSVRPADIRRLHPCLLLAQDRDNYSSKNHKFFIRPSLM